MNETKIKFSADDGHRLAGTLYETRGGQREVCVLLNAAIGLPRDYYAPYARFLAEQGFSVLAFDYRGLGGSRDTEWQGSEPALRDWGERDVAAAIDWLSRERPRYSIVCVGHSFGGVALGLAWNNDRVRALLGIGAQFGYWKLWRWWPPQYRLAQAALWRALVPLSLRLRGAFPGAMLGRAELPAGIARDWARWSCDPNYVTDAQGRPLRQYFDSYRGRVRLYAFADDRFFAPPPAVQALASCYRAAGVELVQVRPADWDMARIGHHGFFRESTPRRVWQETADWLQDAGRLAKRQAIEV